MKDWKTREAKANAELAAALGKAGLSAMAFAASVGQYSDFSSPYGAQKMELAAQLARYGTPEAMEIRKRVIDGEFDRPAGTFIRLALAGFLAYQAAGLVVAVQVVAARPLESAVGAVAVAVGVLMPALAVRAFLRARRGRRAIVRRLNA